MLLRELLADTLGCTPDRINPHASFFSNGGSSLSGITFLGNIKRALNVELTLAEILGYSQLDKLAERLRENAPLPLSMLSGSADRPSLPTLYLVHGAGGQVNQYKALMRRLAPYANIKTLACPAWAATGDASFTLRQLAAAHLTLIPKNERVKSVIAGWSLGGQLAIHMAALATQQGKSFSHAIIIDSGLPLSISLEKPHFSMTKCYLNLFDSLGIARHLYRYEKTATYGDFLDEVRKHYALNHPILGERISLEQAESFCLSIKIFRPHESCRSITSARHSDDAMAQPRSFA